MNLKVALKQLGEEKEALREKVGDLEEALKAAQEEAATERRAVRFYRRQIEALCGVLPD